MVIVLMGVSGVGKSTIGRELANQLGWRFVEGDDFHPMENVAKMAEGTPLTDDDRRPWLDALRRRISEACERDEHVVLACSALKTDYRDHLRQDHPGCVRFFHLHAPREVLRERLAARKGHFAKLALLGSQFEDLEAPKDAILVDATALPELVAGEIRRHLGQ